MKLSFNENCITLIPETEDEKKFLKNCNLVYIPEDSLIKISDSEGKELHAALKGIILLVQFP